MTKGEYFGPDKIDLRQVQFTPELLRSVPADVARRYRVLPIFDDPPFTLHVAFADPIDLDAVDETHFVLKRDLELRIADPQQVDEFIQRLYGSADT
jgi:type IV pilus assembly protein PilB